MTTKSTPTDVVTASDHAVETLVRDRLAALRPGDTVLGEEHGGSAVGPGVHWVVDPIDGTVNFLYGLPWYAVSVAAVRDGRSLAGAVVEPASGRVWSAGLGLGRDLRRGARCRVSGATDVALSLLATGFSYRAERRARQVAMIAGLLPHVRDVRRTGSAALDLCGVAAGWVDAYLEHGCSWWDWAAAALVATEAGAVVRTPGAGGACRRRTGWAPTRSTPRRPRSPTSCARSRPSTARARCERPPCSGDLSVESQRCHLLQPGASAAGRLAGRGERGRVDDRRRGGGVLPAAGSALPEPVVPEPDAPSWSSASRTARPGFTSPNAVPTATSTVSSPRPSRTSSAHGTSSATVLAAPSPAWPKRSWPVHTMSPSGKNVSLVGGAACAKPKSPNWAATRFACPRCPPALSTRTLTVDGGTGGTFASAPAGSTSPGTGPAAGGGQAATPAADAGLDQYRRSR